jgi:hypothetical protein
MIPALLRCLNSEASGLTTAIPNSVSGAGGGLVDQDQGGVGDEGPPDRHPLALAARELLCQVVAPRGQTKFLEELVCRGFDAIASIYPSCTDPSSSVNEPPGGNSAATTGAATDNTPPPSPPATDA